jgi:hypothetical protein
LVAGVTCGAFASGAGTIAAGAAASTCAGIVSRTGQSMLAGKSIWSSVKHGVDVTSMARDAVVGGIAGGIGGLAPAGSSVLGRAVLQGTTQLVANGSARFVNAVLTGGSIGDGWNAAADPSAMAFDFALGAATSRLHQPEPEIEPGESTGRSRPEEQAKPASAPNATEAERLAGRVDEFHGALDPIAQNSRTTSVMSTQEGVDIISSGGRDLSPAQRALAQDGDVLGRMPGAHAEVTSLDAATKAGLSPSQIAVSRPICTGCQIAIQNSGGQILPGGMGAVWPR